MASLIKSSHSDSEDEEILLMGHEAACQGNLQMVTQAIRSDPSALEYQDTQGMTPLAKATEFRQFEVLKMLVKMGANLNTRDIRGRTPLCLAAYEGWYKGIVYLLRNGAKQNIQDENGRQPLHAATYSADTRLLSTLLQSLSLDDINQQDNDGMTALHWAAFHGQHEHVKLLMLRGTDIYITDIDDKTPLHWASQNGSLLCCKALVHCHNGGSTLVNCVEASGKTCVHLAAVAGKQDVIDEFSSIPGVDFEALDPDLRTPLHWASVTGHLESVTILLKLGLDVSARDTNGGTPLDYAKIAGHTEILNILKGAGAKFGSMCPKVDSVGRPNDGHNQTSWQSFFGIFSNLFGSKWRDTSCKNTKKQHGDFGGRQDNITMQTVMVHHGNQVMDERPSTDGRSSLSSGYVDNQMTCDVDITLEQSPNLHKSQRYDENNGGQCLCKSNGVRTDLLDTDNEDEESDEDKAFLENAQSVPLPELYPLNISYPKVSPNLVMNKRLQKYSPLPSPASMKKESDDDMGDPVSFASIGDSSSSNVELTAMEILAAHGLSTEKVCTKLSAKGRLPVLAYRGTINNTDQLNTSFPWLHSNGISSLSAVCNRKHDFSSFNYDLDCLDKLQNSHAKLGDRPRSKSLNFGECSVIASVSASALSNTQHRHADSITPMTTEKSRKKKKSKNQKKQRDR